MNTQKDVEFSGEHEHIIFVAIRVEFHEKFPQNLENEQFIGFHHNILSNSTRITIKVICSCSPENSTSFCLFIFFMICD